MEFKDFEIGNSFLCNGKKWRCTDKGSRAVIAIPLDAPEASWYHGPPYALQEVVFDENDIVTCVNPHEIKLAP